VGGEKRNEKMREKSGTHQIMVFPKEKRSRRNWWSSRGRKEETFEEEGTQAQLLFACVSIHGNKKVSWKSREEKKSR